MLKKVALTLSLICAGSFANGLFVGINGGYASGAVSQDMLVGVGGGWIEGADSETKFNAFSYGAKLGYDHRFSDHHGLKAYIDYSRAAFSGGGIYIKDLTYDIVSINADYHYYFIPQFSAFVGISLGNTWAHTQGFYGNESAFGYGFNVGVNYDISERFALEAKFRYFDSNLPEKTYNLSGTTGYKIEPDDLSQIMIGVIFKF